MKKDNKMKLFLFLASVVLLSQFRLIEHPWNFTPILAFGILAGYYLKNILYGYLLIVASMFLGDVVIGFHYLMLFTYLGLIFSVVIGKYISKIGYIQIFFSSIASSVLFFIISNFGFWLLSGDYLINLNGLMSCYIAGIPFFRSTLISTTIYAFIFKLALDQLKFYSPLIKY